MHGGVRRGIVRAPRPWSTPWRSHNLDPQPKQLCPLKGAPDAAKVMRAGDAVPYVPLASRPRTLGGAMMLLAKESPYAAAALQRRLCGIFLDPAAACDWKGAKAAAGYQSGYREHVLSNAAPPAATSLFANWAKLAAPRQLPGFLSLKDPLEGISEGAAQSALWW